MTKHKVQQIYKWQSKFFYCNKNIYLRKIRVDPVDEGFLLNALLLICNHTSSKVLYLLAVDTVIIVLGAHQSFS